MHSIKPVSFCFHLFLISAAILVAVAVPTVHTRHEAREDLCTTIAIPRSPLDIRNLEQSAYCHYKVCEDKFGYKNGQTRNPDVIYRIVCEETTVCKQVYLTVEVAHYTNGSLNKTKNETLPHGCLYSTRDLRNSSTVVSLGPSTFS